MNHYTNKETSNIHNETFAFIKVDEADNVLTITLDRASKKNAIHPHTLNELAFALQYAKVEKSIWAVVLQAEGNVFCAGADLKAFMGLVGEFESTIPAPKGQILIGELFNKVYKPTIAKVEGDVYAGGFMFLAGCTYVVALDDLKFGLPEVKRGLYPFQVMESLLRVMPPRKVIDWCIRGYNLAVPQAAELGLVTHVVQAENINETIDNLLTDLKANSPSAIRLGLEAFDNLQSSEANHKYLYEMLQKTIGTKDGQEGIMAFREKRQPVWTGE